MNLPAKVFVVLNLLLAVVFAVVSMSLFAKRADWYQRAHEFKRDRDKLQASLDAEKQQRREEVSKWRNEATTLTEKVSLLEPAIARLEAENESLKANNEKHADNIANLEKRMQEANTTLRKILTEKKSLEDQLETVREQNEVLKDDRNFAQKSVLELSAELQDERARRTELQKRNSSLMEQNLAYQSAIARVRAAGQGRLISDAKPAPEVRGRVLRVVEDQDLVVVSLGKNDNLEPGMELVISRGSEYIGKVRVGTSIEENMAATYVIRPLTQQKIQKGDIAETLSL